MKEANFGFDLLLNNIIESFNLTYNIINSFYKRSNKKQNYFENDIFDFSAINKLMINYIFSNPEKFLDSYIEFYQEYIKIVNNILTKSSNKKIDSLYNASPDDKRFNHFDWHINPYFDFVRQIYLMFCEVSTKFFAKLPHQDIYSEKKMNFYNKKLLEFLSPTNLAATNPEAINEFFSSNGTNIINGLKKFAADLSENENFSVKTINSDYFILGKNIATSEGKVIYQNDLMQLIHYKPLKEENLSVPLLIIPPWINKYYIFDLSPKKSFINWLLENGLSVFIISWINPDKNLSDKNFEDYMLEGPIAAMNIIENITNIREFSLMGYCIGGTLLATTLAYLAKKTDNRVKNATFLTTPIDFANMGDLSIFLSPDTLDSLEIMTKKQGFLDGAKINNFFNMIKANEMIWSFFVNNYLLGKEPFNFDILYWNSDNTHLTSSMFNFYIRNIYANNLLMQPNKIILDNIGIDLNMINIPLYMLSTKSDHIVPWENTFKATKFFKDNLEFILASSGHVAGVMNHPSSKKYSYFINKNLNCDPQEWLEKSTEITGSWWNHWLEWNKQFSSYTKNSLYEYTKYFAIEEAPGSYVKRLCKVKI